MELPADCDAEAEGLLRPVLAARMAAASRYKGTVNQVMGDGIMALVDDPIAARGPRRARVLRGAQDAGTCEEICWGKCVGRDRKSTRLNSSHLGISYAVFCLK